jgi:hypothetical protein
MTSKTLKNKSFFIPWETGGRQREYNRRVNFFKVVVKMNKPNTFMKNKQSSASLNLPTNLILRIFTKIRQLPGFRGGQPSSSPVSN